MARVRLRASGLSRHASKKRRLVFASRSIVWCTMSRRTISAFERRARPPAWRPRERDSSGPPPASVPGIEEDAHLRAHESRGELADLGVECLLAEIEALEHAKAELLQREAHIGGVVPGVLEPGRVPVGGIADDERDAAVRGRRQSARPVRDGRRGGDLEKLPMRGWRAGPACAQPARSGAPEAGPRARRRRPASSSTSSTNQAPRPATSFTALLSEMPAASLTALVRDVSSLMRVTRLRRNFTWRKHTHRCIPALCPVHLSACFGRCGCWIPVPPGKSGQHRGQAAGCAPSPQTLTHPDPTLF